MSAPYLFHGGVHGLNVGDTLLPSPPHVTDGCPLCVARAEGRTMTVGEFRAWLSTKGEAARPALEALADADDCEPIDPPTPQDAVYLTSDEEYARWYAARSNGDLYRAIPVGEFKRSTEDKFPTWTAREARVVEVLERNVRLRRFERRRLMRRWAKLDRGKAA